MAPPRVAVPRYTSKVNRFYASNCSEIPHGKTNRSRKVIARQVTRSAMSNTTATHARTKTKQKEINYCWRLLIRTIISDRFEKRPK